VVVVVPVGTGSLAADAVDFVFVPFFVLLFLILLFAIKLIFGF
jgi:hypothetical protein